MNTLIIYLFSSGILGSSVPWYYLGLIHKQIACKHNGNPQRRCIRAEAAQHSHLQCRTRARTGSLVKMSFHVSF